MNYLDTVNAPWWENRIDLPAFLEDLAKQMRNGLYSPSIECVVMTRDMETDIITICRWGEDTGLCKEDVLREVAEVSRTTA